MNKEEKLKNYHQKLFTQFLSGICYLLNGFQNPARKPASSKIKHFPANSEKNLLNLTAKQLKLQHCSQPPSPAQEERRQPAWTCLRFC